MKTQISARINTARYGIMAVLCLLLIACGAESRLPTQVWQDVTVGLESRPAPVVAGMNEFLVSAVRASGAAEYNLLVSIRMSDDQPWVQAIQDGHTGVFRRAVAVRGDAPHTLRVRLVREGQEGVLAFELPAAKEDAA